MDWSSEKHGDFINLQAFRDCPDLRRKGARLPDWKTIRKHYPQLIDTSPKPDRWFISHRWDGETAEGEPPHPDPSGWQLEALLQLGDHYNYDRPNLCIWYDYMSLPQKPRSAEEAVIFGVGLSNIRHVVAECQNLFLVSAIGSDQTSDLAEHLKRGWIVFELYIARSNIRIPLTLHQRDKGRVNTGRAIHGWDATVPSIHAIAPWEDAAQLEQWFRNRGIACTNGSDLAFLAAELHDSLNRFPYSGSILPVSADGVTVLTTGEISQFAFINGCGLSPRRPDLFLEGANFDPATHVWEAKILKRPAALPLGAWTALSLADIRARLIDLKSGRSPMYPGIAFEISGDGAEVRATVE